MKKLLLISNSTTAGEPYLKYPIGRIGSFLSGVGSVAFVPYAAVTFSYDEYEAKVQQRFDEIGVRVCSVHKAASPAQAIMQAEAICVGGGNTFALIKKMQEQGLTEAIAARVAQGVPYVGWSAGSNVMCPTICTTNDMPILQPQSFEAVGGIKFQINPHYLDAHPDGAWRRDARAAHFGIHRSQSRHVRSWSEGGLHAPRRGFRNPAHRPRPCAYSKRECSRTKYRRRRFVIPHVSGHEFQHRAGCAGRAGRR